MATNSEFFWSNTRVTAVGNKFGILLVNKSHLDKNVLILIIITFKQNGCKRSGQTLGSQGKECVLIIINPHTKVGTPVWGSPPVVIFYFTTQLQPSMVATL
jgi:hypothetical protein